MSKERKEQSSVEALKLIADIASGSTKLEKQK